MFRLYLVIVLIYVWHKKATVNIFAFSDCFVLKQIKIDIDICLYGETVTVLTILMHFHFYHYDD